MAESLRKFLLLVDINFSPEEADFFRLRPELLECFRSSHGWFDRRGYAPERDMVSLARAEIASQESLRFFGERSETSEPREG
jgi:hypothetical protein